MTNSGGEGEGPVPVGEAARRSGVSVAVLRAWEERHGFPRPTRGHGGHRRYTAAQIDEVRRVVEARGRGLSVEAAIDLVSAARTEGRSIFAALRARHPHEPVVSLSGAAMLAISHAIEDECGARALAPVLVGAFQHEAAFLRARPRWTELARTARSTFVFADFASSRSGDGHLDEIALRDDAPMRREWTVVCDAPGVAACLAGWESLASR